MRLKATRVGEPINVLQNCIPLSKCWRSSLEEEELELCFQSENPFFAFL